MAHEANGDFGYEWLKTNSAGSGAYKLRAVQAVRQLRARGGAGRLARRPAARRASSCATSPEPATQRLLLENGDIDIARKLTPVDVAGDRAATPTSRSSTSSAAASTTSALNQKVEPLNNPKVIEAVKYLIDYEGMADSFLKGSNIVHQSFLPAGFLGAIDDTALHARRREGEGAARGGRRRRRSTSSSTSATTRSGMEIAQSLQNTMAQAGINVELRVGTGAEILGEYRARNHEMIMEAWGPDYPDPHTNADTFARNPDNSRRGQATPASSPGATPGRPTETNDLTNAAVLEQDGDKRAEMYQEIQRIHQQVSPFAPHVPADRAGGDARERRGLLGRRLGQLRRLLHDDEVAAEPAGPHGPPDAAMAHQEDITGPGHLERAARARRAGSPASSLTPGGDAARAARRHLRHRPGDPDRPGARRSSASAPPRRSTRRRARRSASNDPLWVQFAIYVRDAVTGDFGKSLLTGQPVIDDIARVFPATLELATIATLIGVLLGIPAGVLAATRPGTLADQVGAARRPRRLLDAGLLARADGAAGLLRQAAAGSAGRAGSTPPTSSSTSSTCRGVTGSILIDSRARRRLGRVRQRAHATSSCRPRCSATTRWPTSAG